MKPVIATSLKIAAAQVGVRESNDNSGPKVREYQAATTLGGTHWPWCAALIAWDFRETEKALKVEIPWSYSASCDVLLADGKARGIVHTTPQVGDVMLVRAKKSARNGGGYSTTDMIHTGIVESVGPGGSFGTIEGNTNNDGGREGIGVMRHTRNVNDGRYYFIRWADALPDAKAPEPYTASIEVHVGSGGSVRALPSKTENNTVLVAARFWGEALGKSVGWDNGNGVVTFDGEEVPLQPRLFDGVAYFPLRALTDLSGGTVMVDAAARTARAVITK
ncbi:hypothetical protein IAD21_00584 [Abditibacteriota bacterium]|nr:hypothetical protein IAD21_00584 [Abditibacteriota bacterium]